MLFLMHIRQIIRAQHRAYAGTADAVTSVWPGKCTQVPDVEDVLAIEERRLECARAAVLLTMKGGGTVMLSCGQPLAQIS